MTYNIRPVQIRPIEWPWKNRVIDGMPHLVWSPGEIVMPEIISCFDWSRCEISERPGLLPEASRPLFVTCDLKSVFTTALRFLGFERGMLAIADGIFDAGPIREAFVVWHERFMAAFGAKIDAVVIGDDWAHNGGMMISPDDWRTHVAPFIREVTSRGVWAIYVHSDGDVGEILDDLVDLGVRGLIYEPVGSMRRLVAGEYCGMRLIESDPPLEEYQGYSVKESGG